ncbi:MAG: homoserine O-succinyltransferase [Eubacteriales bacterium]|nr:homoserine O-succinyltransferase [Eubacteriales bacterium]
MPVIIPRDLPATKRLLAEDIFLMHEKRAKTQDIRPLRIAIVNLMPKKIETETQLLRLLSNTPLQIEIDFITTKSYVGTHTPLSHMDKFYITLDDIRSQRYDGMIITGAPVEHLPFEEVAYWSEMKDILDFSISNTFSTMYICWASQAALYHMYGIDKFTTDKKIFGVFPHTLTKPHSITRGFDDVFHIPHSRHTRNRVRDVAAVDDLEILSISEESGLFLTATKDGRRFFASGHVEYDRYTLAREYERDREKRDDVALPQNYFPDNDPSRKPLQNWRSDAHLLFSNWLNYHVYQVTPFDLSGTEFPKGK